MKEQGGILGYTSGSGQDAEYVIASSNDLKGEYGSRFNEIAKDVLNKIRNGSENQSNIYYTSKTYANKNGDYVSLCVYGVKGSARLNRGFKYAEVLFCRPEIMFGYDEGLEDNQNGDNARGDNCDIRLFATKYVDHDYGKQKDDDAIKQELLSPSVCLDYKTDSEQDTGASYYEKIYDFIIWLWDISNQHKDFKVVIRLQDVEKQSMSLLRRVYRLLPRKMREKYGFVTNAVAWDYTESMKLQLPVMFFTIGEDVDLSFADLHVYDFTSTNKRVNYNKEDNKHFLELLQQYAPKLWENMWLDTEDFYRRKLDLAETMVIEEKRKIGIQNRTELPFLKEVYDNYEGVMFWSEKEPVQGYQNLDDAYDAKKHDEYLMTESLRRKCIREFRDGLWTNHNLIDSISAEGRSQILEELGISDLRAIRECVDKRVKSETQELANKNEEMEARIQELEKEKDKLLRSLEKQREESNRLQAGEEAVEYNDNCGNNYDNESGGDNGITDGEDQNRTDETIRVLALCYHAYEVRTESSGRKTSVRNKSKDQDIVEGKEKIIQYTKDLENDQNAKTNSQPTKNENNSNSLGQNSPDRKGTDAINGDVSEVIQQETEHDQQDSEDDRLAQLEGNNELLNLFKGEPWHQLTKKIAGKIDVSDLNLKLLALYIYLERDRENANQYLNYIRENSKIMAVLGTDNDELKEKEGEFRTILLSYKRGELAYNSNRDLEDYIRKYKKRSRPGIKDRILSFRNRFGG